MKILFFLLTTISLFAEVQLGIDRIFTDNFSGLLAGKRIGLITNHTGINRQLKSSIDLFKERQGPYTLVALFSPEHGLNGLARAFESVESSTKKIKGVAIHSLHGKTRRPTSEMLKGIDLLVYDIQEIGCRSYTYASTLFYAMEEAAKRGIGVIVLDRPNPMGGVVVDGPMLKAPWRSFMGYVNVPYCHGMTIGELARFFNKEYKINCKLTVVPMTGWVRTMSFKDTNLAWIPTSPYIPEADTPFYYASTGILGALGLVNIGIGYTLPFKVVGAPWINAETFAASLNAQKLPGVSFVPFHYRPFYGMFKEKDCQGVKIVITNSKTYRPLAVQFLLIGVLKSLYPKQFQEKVNHLTAAEKTSFCKVNGNEEMLKIIQSDRYIGWKLVGHDEEERAAFLEKRKPYLLYH